MFQQGQVFKLKTWGSNGSPPGRARRLRPSRMQEWPGQGAEDGSQHPRGAAADGRAHCAGAAAGQWPVAFGVPVAWRRLLRPPQLPQPLLEASQLAAGVTPLRRVYDLRHTFATFALRAGISTFELSRYMGTSFGMIDRHYGHLARDGREHAIRLLDLYTGEDRDVHAVDAGWTLILPTVAAPENATIL